MLPRPVDPIRGWRRAALVGVKTVHTAAFFSIGSCLVYLAYSGLTKRSDRRAAIAGAVVTGETLIYAANGFRCPLTDMAQRLESKHPSVADIYLPRWLESHLPLITGPIFAGAVILHVRNIIESRGERSPNVTRPRRRQPTPHRFHIPVGGSVSARVIETRAGIDDPVVRRQRALTRSGRDHVLPRGVPEREGSGASSSGERLS